MIYLFTACLEQQSFYLAKQPFRGEILSSIFLSVFLFLPLLLCISVNVCKKDTTLYLSLSHLFLILLSPGKRIKKIIFNVGGPPTEDSLLCGSLPENIRRTARKGKLEIIFFADWPHRLHGQYEVRGR